MTRANQAPFDFAIAATGLPEPSPRSCCAAAGLGAHGLPGVGVSPRLRRHAEWGAMHAAPCTEHLVDRGAFDAGLRRAAAAEGVAVIEAAITRVTPGLITPGLITPGLIAPGRVALRGARRMAG